MNAVHESMTIKDQKIPEYGQAGVMRGDAEYDHAIRWLRVIRTGARNET
jgi:hypothetical protein